MGADRKGDGGGERAPCGEVVYGYQGVCAVADPAEAGEDAGGTGGAEERHGDGTEALAGSWGGEVVVVVCNGRGDVGDAGR